MSHRARVEILCEVLKAVRAKPLTFAELLEVTGGSKNTLRRWLKELILHGLLLCGPGEKVEGRRGFAPFVYRLSPDWGGRS